MKKILFYLYDGLTDFELTMPSLVVNCYLGYEVITFSENKKMVQSLTSLKYQTDYSIEEALEMENIDGIIIPGGVNLKFYPNLNKLINKLDQDKKLIAAICAGPQFLAEAGILKTHKFTVSETKETLKKGGYVDYFNWDNFVDKPFVRSEHIITGQGQGFISFSAEIMDYFNGFESPSDKDEFIFAFSGA